MEVSLKNIGKIKETNIVLNGITVIAGENDTGKSTVNRAVFSILNNFYKSESQIQKQQEASIAICLFPWDNTLPSAFSSPQEDFYGLSGQIAKKILKKAETYKNNPERLRSDFTSYFASNSKVNEDYAKKSISNIIDILNLSKNEFFSSIFEMALNQEFNSQVQNIYCESDSEITLKIDDITISVCISKGHVSKMEQVPELYTNAFYLDTPDILNDGFPFFSGKSDHRTQLRNALFHRSRENSIIKEVVARKKLEHIYAMLDESCAGQIIEISNGEYGYKQKNSKEILDVRNLSAGLKSFVILKTLLQNGSIESGSIILLDEPEIHLHPEWQLLFAEILVLLYKEFDLHILLNTHSHYFLDAIETYSEKHGVTNSCKYYLASLDGSFATIKDVTENTEEIYKKLARPLQKLENERYRNED